MGAEPLREERPVADPYLLKRPEEETFVRELEDKEGNPGLVFKFRLRRLDPIEQAHVEGKRIGYWAKHFVGTKANAAKPLPAVDGKPITMKLESCRILATIEAAQCPREGEKLWTFREIAAMASVPALSLQFWGIYGEILPDDLASQDDEAPNAGEGSTAPT
ncbi:MAG: hypothetical protein IH945_02045 [Armatimonadetes bacterium]|nr:hypothetical protein [Armatimonadota bacterium]